MIEKKLVSKIFFYSTLICLSQCNNGNVNNNGNNDNANNNGNNDNNQPRLSELVSIIKDLKTFTSTEIQAIDKNTQKKLANSLIKNKNELNNIKSFLCSYGDNENLDIDEKVFVETLKDYEEKHRKKHNSNTPPTPLISDDDETKTIIRKGIIYHRKKIIESLKFLDNQDTANNGINNFINEINESSKQIAIRNKLIYIYILSRINTDSTSDLKADNIVQRLSYSVDEINFTIDYYLNPKFNINNI